MQFCVGICTANRPKMLARLLESLTRLTAPSAKPLTIIVVENSSSPLSLGVVEEFRPVTPIPIQYYLETRIGIPYARNRILDAALDQQAEWIAMLDDDEHVTPTWLVNLYDACLRYRAEVATGPVRKEFENPPPQWWPWLEEQPHPTGTLKRDAYTNNVLFNRCLIAPDGLNLRFDERLIAGAEDVIFFRQARAKGARIVFVAEAVVTETVPCSRLTLMRALHRVYMVASSNSLMGMICEGRVRGAVRRLPAIVRRTMIGLALLIGGGLAWPVKKTTGQRIMIKGVISLTKAWGAICGMLGLVSNYYLTLDGS